MLSIAFALLVLDGCVGKTVDAGTNDGGATSDGSAASDSGSPPGAPVTLVSAQQEPVRLASDGTTLYWTHDGVLSSMPVHGGTPSEPTREPPNPHKKRLSHHVNQNIESRLLEILG
jgi:hypothetical protein